MLEQIAYELPREQRKVYTIGDLEGLSAMHLYDSGPLKFDDIPMFNSGIPSLPSSPLREPSGIKPIKISKIQPSPDLTIRDFPASGFQLHIHEGETTKPSSIKTYSQDKFLLSSYDAAMADAGKPAYDAMELLNNLSKQEKDQLQKMFEDYFKKKKNK